jgi:DNA mismatch repair ATPase MutS
MKYAVPDRYKSRISQLNKQLEDLNQKDSRYALLRLVIAIIGIAGLILAFQQSFAVGFLSLVFLVIVFLLIYIKHESVKERLINTQSRIAVNQNEINCLVNHDNEYNNGLSFNDPAHPYTSDLDIFGSYSLYNLVNRCKTDIGKRTLASYLSDFDSLENIKRRRESIQEISQLPQFKEDLTTILYSISEDHSEEEVENILASLNNDYSVFDNSKWKFVISVLPFFWILIIILWITGVPFMQNIAVITGILIFTTYFIKMKVVNEIHNNISQGNRLLDTYGLAFRQIYFKKWKSSLLNELLADQNYHSRIDAVFQLKKLIDLFDYRLNMIAGTFLNIFMLWDFRIIQKLKTWKDDHHEDIAELFSTLGKVEALTSLATWAYNHPEYVYATIDANHLHINAQNIYHPLMETGQCVPNSINIEQEDYINIITGSNMSGKSTILRTIAINIILAYAGTTSAAGKLSISHARVMTYMRIKDALEENVSTFKAELDRVQLMLSYMDNYDNCLFLIDEMLRGTNSKDKLKGSIAITEKILNQKAYAIIATHDIQLAELSHQYPSGIKNYYFDIEFKEGELVFDYKIKSGICSNFNASFLLEKIGIK